MSSTRSVGGTDEGDMPVTRLAAQTIPASRAVTSRIAPAIFALVLGASLLVLAGFAWPSALHNATHDTRHALGLPCH